MDKSGSTDTKRREGRPFKWASVDEFQTKADEYFAQTPRERWTITGLALHLETFRDVLIDYQNKDEFSYAVKNAKLKVESAYEESLRLNGRAGDIFGLKNFGWRDRTESEQTVKATNTNINLDGGEVDKSIVDAFVDQLKHDG